LAPFRVEEEPDAKRELLQLIFERVWLDDGRIVAVRPKEKFTPFFVAAKTKPPEKRCVEDGSEGTRTRERHRIEIRA
jgi:hypothetical protein